MNKVYDRWIGTASVVGILALLLLSIGCISTPSASATNELTGKAKSGVSTVSIAAPAAIDLEILPSVEGALSYKAADVSIASSQTDGFRILVNGEKTELVNNHHTDVITSISAKTALNALPKNTWGVYLGASVPIASSVFSPVSTTAQEMAKNDLANASGTYKLAIGAKVDTSLPAGLYSNELVISVAADPVKVFSGITYMQDMTSDICAAAEENDTMQLIDKRDGKSYWVAKLKDGNCWMTQNLALDITEEGLSATDTDIEEDWNQSSTYQPKNTITKMEPNGEYNDNYNTLSWSLGKYVVATPLEYQACSQFITSFAECEKVGVVDVSGEEWKPAFMARTGTFTYPDGKTYNGYVTVDQATHTYDAHYLVGNYYQFNTATAGTDFKAAINIEGSICPKGWDLPTAGSDGFETNGSFAYMLKQYGLASNYESGVISAGEYNALKNPIYSNRTGFVYGVYGLYNSPNESGIWSSVTYGSYANACMAYWRSSNSLSPSSMYTSNGNRYYGLSVRCLTTGK